MSDFYRNQLYQSDKDKTYWHEKCLKLEAQLAQAVEVLKDIQKNPFGCVYCDSGILRNPKKDHEKNCGFFLIYQTLAAIQNADKLTERRKAEQAVLEMAKAHYQWWNKNQNPSRKCCCNICITVEALHALGQKGDSTKTPEQAKVYESLKDVVEGAQRLLHDFNKREDV